MNIPKKKRSPSYNAEGLLGKVSGLLTVTGVTNFPPTVQCKCECGKTRDVRIYLWNKGKAKSCGNDCKIAHPVPNKAPTTPKEVINSATKWAVSLKKQMLLKKLAGWKLVGVIVYGSGFNIISPPGYKGRGKPKMDRDNSEIVGYYTPDIPVEFLTEDIKICMEERLLRGNNRSWNRV